jgi:hypothetical protein
MTFSDNLNPERNLPRMSKEVGVLADAHLSITRNVIPYYSRCFVLAIIWSCTSLCISVK